MQLCGVVFDLDGTVIDSGLNFEQIRAEMELPAGRPILEALDEMPPGDRRDDCFRILREHEERGAERATLMPGVVEFLEELARRRLHCGVLTRNSRASTARVLDRLGLNFSEIMTRDDVPPKPDPEGILRICRAWNVAPQNVLMIGDFLFDLQAGSNAGARTVLYAPGALPDYADEADETIRHFAEAVSLLDRL